MNTFTISKTLNKTKVFILQKNELEKRLDPFFYMPELLELEKKVLAKKPKKLRDYVVSIASGSTPKRAEEEKYYSDKENGIPFLRVQNLSATGILKLEKVKHINTETHNGLLKRSQVSEGDLLVKITGVGRMAVASVAPKDFVGNINQHICVIKTKNRKVSETLASFLNSDIGEKLASRRSTGGTRPALDYPALLSIPIIEDERILQIKKELVKQKTANKQKAEKLLASIDTYLLKELSIELPEKQENTLKSRMFIRSIKDISGSRFDPFYNKLEFDFFKNLKSKFNVIAIRKINTEIKTGFPVRKDLRVSNGKYPYYGANGIIGFMNEFTHNGEYLVIGQDGYIGKHYVVNGKFWGSNHNWVLKLQQNINYIYIKEVLDVINYDYAVSGSVIPKLTKEALESIKIPLPPKEKQDEIANHITTIRKQAQALKDKTKVLIIESNKEIESILLN
jgi:restriction endonuclease S subunit